MINHVSMQITHLSISLVLKNFVSFISFSISLCTREVTFDVLAKPVSVTINNSISNCELPHFEWILLSSLLVIHSS